MAVVAAACTSVSATTGPLRARVAPVPTALATALEAGILPFAIQFAPDGSLIVTQVEPIPAIRRVDLPGGTITTLVRGRRR